MGPKHTNDLSDEAFWEWDEGINRLHMDRSFSEHALDGWQERGRREQLRYDQAIECWTESINEKNKEIEREMRLLKAALQALRSYQYGNSSPDLAKEIADKIDQYHGTETHQQTLPQS